MDVMKKKIVWFCGIPEKVRVEAFADQGLLHGNTWSWIVGHLPPPPNIDLHIVCADRRLKADVTRTWGGATFHLLKVPRGGPFLMYESWVPAFVRKSRELNPDVVHGWGTECAFGLAALRAAPKKHLIGIQGILVVFWPYMPKSVQTTLCTFNELRVLRKVKRCVAESEYSKTTVSQFTGAKISVIPHPLREEFRNATLGPRNEKIIIYLGTLYRRKGIFDALKSFISLNTDWKLVCIGTAPSSRQQKKIDRYIMGLAASDRDRIVFAGTQTIGQIIEWFRRSPLFFLPSYADTGPTALKEALSMGLWPVCYDNTGPQELIGRYGVGTLVPTGDVKLLAEALNKVIAERVWENNTALASCVATIRQDLAPAAIWEKLTQVYDECSGRSDTKLT